MTLRRATAFRRQTPSEAAALLAGCPPCELAAQQAAEAAGFAITEPTGETVPWSGVLVIEETLTGDGRFIESNALRWGNLPIPLRWAPTDIGAHGGAVVVGRIETIERADDGQILATGLFDLGSEHGREAARLVGEEWSNGISVDLDDVSFEVRVSSELIEGMGDELPGADADGKVTVVKINSDDEVMAVTDAGIRAATLVDIPAFAGAFIKLDSALPFPPKDSDDDSDENADPTPPDCSCDEDADNYDPECDCSADEDDDTDEDSAPVPPGLAASAFPVRPPLEWFANPNLSEPTRVTITDDGRVYGHLAEWGVCHTGMGDQCVTAPSSAAGYAYFTTGSVLTEDGTEVPTGVITMDTLHAQPSLRATATLAHYENTGRAVADVMMGEDSHGIWFSGALRSNVTEEQVRALRAAPLSGDWRRIGGSLELVAALAVNVPGFPVRPKALVASGHMESLVASGIVQGPDTRSPQGTLNRLDPRDLELVRRVARRERAAEAANLRTRVRVAAMAMRLRS